MVEKKLEGAQLIVRLVAVVSGIIVLALIVDKLKVADLCTFGNFPFKSESCDFGIAMGAISLALGLILSVVNVLALVLPSPLALVFLPGGRRRMLVTIDIILSVVIGLVWFACGVFTATELKDRRDAGNDSTRDKEQNATVFFEFLSFLMWLISAGVGIGIHKKSDTILPGDN